MTATVFTNIPEEWITALSSEAAAAEEQGALTSGQLDIIFKAGWFRMFLPQSLGGLNLSLPEALRLEETLARIDGSLGWTVTLCSGATMFAGFMEEALATELLSNPHACFGGSGAATGVAEKRGDTYIISGRWKYATGAPHLSAFTANCRIYEHGVELKDEAGEPLTRAFVFRADEVKVLQDWNTMGLRATAGHSFELSHLTVPADRAFDIEPGAAKLSGLVFQYPFLPFAETTLAVNTSGMVLHFLDCCEGIFAEKALATDATHAALLRSLLNTAQKKMAQLREAFYVVTEASWTELCENRYCTPEILKKVGVESRALVQEARNIVLQLFPYCGMAATNPESPVNRVWRDIFTASQHSLLNRH